MPKSRVVVKTPPASVLLKDLGSGNGTKVNGTKVAEKKLEHGDEISIGKFMLTFQSDGAAAPGGTAKPAEALQRLVRAGKVRAIGLSNETPWGVSEFVKVAERAGLPRVATVQNPYCLVNRVVDNGLDEVMWREQVSLLAYSPLGFGLLTGKYDDLGLEDPARPGRLAIFDSMKKQRWGRIEALDAARRYNALARAHGLSPTQLALAFCYHRWSVASTIIGVTSLAQLDEDIDAWDVKLDAAVLAEIDAIRWTHRDPGQ